MHADVVRELLGACDHPEPACLRHGGYITATKQLCGQTKDTIGCTITFCTFCAPWYAISRSSERWKNCFKITNTKHTTIRQRNKCACA